MDVLCFTPHYSSTHQYTRQDNTRKKTYLAAIFLPNFGKVPPHKLQTPTTVVLFVETFGLNYQYRYVNFSIAGRAELAMIASGDGTPCANIPAELFLSDDIFRIKDGCVSLIARVHLPRSVKSFVTAGSVAPFEVCFTSEFHDPVDISMEPSRLMATFLKCCRSPTASDIRQACLSAFEVPLINSKKNSQHFKIKFPDEIDVYRLYLFLHQKSPQDGVIITLPLLTDRFNVVSEHTMTLQNDVASLLSCFRFVDGVIIQEDYGRTMGSHIYDCSVAILRYIKMLCTSGRLETNGGKPFKGARRKVAVELGAGCGLVSIWLSKQLRAGRVIATDMSCQTPLLLRNIAVNEAQDTCTVKALDWSLFTPEKTNADTTRKNDCPPLDASAETLECNATDEKDVDSPIVRDAYDASPSNRLELQKYHLGIEDGEYLDMILAGDVLYSKSLATNFFNVIKTLAVPNETSIIVAQRLRNSDERDTFDVRSIPGLTCDVIWEEAKVVIWKIHVIP